jgi:hypothetical protein
MPHVHISGINAVVAALFMVVFFGGTHLLASSYPSATLSQAWFGLGF